MHFSRTIITGLEPSKGFRCFVPGCDNLTNPSYADIDANWIHPRTSSGDLDFCKQYKLKRGYDSCSSEDVFNSSDIFELGSCSKIIYNDFEFENTFVTENNLICDEQYKVTDTQK